MHRRRTGSADSHHEGGVPVTGCRRCASGAHRPEVGTRRIVPIARTSAIEETALPGCTKGLHRCHAGDAHRFLDVSPDTSSSGATTGPRARPGSRRLRVPDGFSPANKPVSRSSPTRGRGYRSRPALADPGRRVVHEALRGVAALTRGLLAALTLEL